METTTSPASNRYSAPRARVDDVDDIDQTQAVKYFSARGRIGRLRMLAFQMGAVLLVQAANLLLGLVSAIAGQWAFFLGFAVIMIPYIWFIAVTTIQRTHDMNLSGWFALICLIPFVALAWVFIPGTRGSNRFGAPPPPNSTGVKVLALLLPIIAGIGILAAVAIPAYQAYTLRAKAAQTQMQVPAPAKP